MIATLVVAFATVVAAAETDPYYGWLHPPRDGREAMNAAIEAQLEAGLRHVNRAPPSSCRDAALGMTAPLASTSAWFWAGSTRSWRVDRSPRTRTEYDEKFRGESTYRYSALLPFGSMVPLDPTVRVGDVLFGTDKIGHFFNNGARYYDRYRAAAAAGDKDPDVAAIMVGVDEERGILGLGVSGIFSYADLETNYRGMQFYQELCDGGGLARDKRGAWHLTRSFDISRYVDPCWDEGFYPSAFKEAHSIARAIQKMCMALHAPALESRRAKYRAMGCNSRSVDVLDALAAKGETPKQLSLDDVCASTKPGPTPSGAGR